MNTSSHLLWAASSSARLVVVLVTLLVILGIVMALLTAWLIVSTRPERPALAPLEVMGQRRWRNASPSARRSFLDEVRPRSGEPPDEEPVVDDVGTPVESDGVAGAASASDDESRDDVTPARGVGIVDRGRPSTAANPELSDDGGNVAL